MLTRAIFINDTDISNFNRLNELGREVEVRQVPTDAKKYIHELLK